jgi:hypothetical protein
MRFAVTRTSSYLDDETPPCDGAAKGTLPRWDVRTFKSFEEHDAKLTPPWLSRGTDHQVITGPRGGATGIKRRMEDGTAWFVDIDSLEALVAFHDKHGDLVLTEAFGNNGHPCLEIYDDYRE